MTPLVLIPGLACNDELFAPQAAALSDASPAVIIASTRQGDTIGAIAAAVLADAPPVFALGGLSMGGYVAFEILRQAPERVERLALMDTTARPDAPEQSAQRRVLVERAKAGELEAIMREIAPRLVHPDRRADQALIDVQVRMGLDIGAEAFARQQDAIISRPDSRPDLGSIRVPTLVLVGDRDPLTPPIRAREMAEALPNSTLSIIARCGHISTLEQPTAVNAALAEWLST